MENIINIFSLLFLAVIFGLAIFNWLYALEVQRVNRLEGFAIPQSLESFLRINRFFPFVAAAVLLGFILFAA